MKVSIHIIHDRIDKPPYITTEFEDSFTFNEKQVLILNDMLSIASLGLAGYSQNSISDVEKGESINYELITQTRSQLDNLVKLIKIIYSM